MPRTKKAVSAPKRNASPKTKTDASAVLTNVDEQIRARAYEIYQERGGTDGLDKDDWLRAEAEIRRKASA